MVLHLNWCALTKKKIKTLHDLTKQTMNISSKFPYMCCDLGKSATCRTGQFCRNKQNINLKIVAFLYFLLILCYLGCRYHGDKI